MRFFSVIIVLFNVCIAGNCQAQKSADASASTVNNDCCIYTKTDEYKTYLESVTKKTAENLDKKIKKEYNEIISEKNNDLIKELNDNNFLFDTAIVKYLSSIFYYIVDKNGLDKNAFHFFVNRSPEVNAYTYEDGTIVCNLGLLNIAETESQVAMIFCHELAHYLLNHGNISVISSIEKFNSPEFIEKVKAIKKEKYNTKKQLEDLLVTDLYNKRRHNRAYEIAADSLGMILFGKTSYGARAIPNIFNRLDSSDNIQTLTTIKDFCNRENITANDSWFVVKKKMSFGVAVKKEMKDTLRTHPDCALRRIYAEDYFAKNPKQGPDFVLSTNTRLNSIKELSFNGQAKYAKDREALSYYLYQLIQNDIRFPSDKIIKTEIFNLFVSFCQKQKNHTLAYVIQTPYATENENDEYAKLLRLLHESDLPKLKEMAIAYYEKNKNFITLNSELDSRFSQIKQY